MVGHTITTAVLVIVVPFIILTVLSVPHIQPGNWLKMDLEAVDWSTFLNVMFWNLNYW